MDAAPQSIPTAYTAACIHCARVVFRGARRLGATQLSMIENHVLICRPLATHKDSGELLAHFRITETAHH